MIDRVDNILGKTLAHLGLGRTSDVRRLMDGWKKIVGERIAAQATPLALKGTELVIAVPNAVWRQELTLMTPELQDRINGALGLHVVEKIRLVSHGPVLAGSSPFQPRRRILKTHGTSPHGSDPDPAIDLPSLSPGLRKAFAGLQRARARRLDQDQRKTVGLNRK